jgi:enolase
MKLYEYVSFMTGEDHKKHIMPVPLITVVNGGVYSSGSLWLEDIFLMPQGAESYSEALRMGSECYFALQQIMEEADPNSLNTGFSGGLTPNIIDAEEILQLIQRAIKAAGHEGLVTIGVDAGAQNFYDEVEDAYNLNFKVNKTQGPNYMNSDEMIDFYVKIAEEYGVQLIEDPFHEDAWESYRVLNTKLNNNVRSISNQVQLVGDNLLASNIQRIKIGARKKSCNTLMLKPNQIGSVSEAIKAASEADNQDFSLIVSQRGGETEDNFICDLAIGLNTGQVKLGAPMR